MQGAGRVYAQMAAALTLHGLTVVFFAAIGGVDAMERGAGRPGRARARIKLSFENVRALRLHMRAPRMRVLRMFITRHA